MACRALSPELYLRLSRSARGWQESWHALKFCGLVFSSAMLALNGHQEYHNSWPQRIEFALFITLKTLPVNGSIKRIAEYSDEYSPKCSVVLPYFPAGARNFNPAILISYILIWGPCMCVCVIYISDKNNNLEARLAKKSMN